jgi:hypothetical protein
MTLTLPFLMRLAIVAKNSLPRLTSQRSFLTTSLMSKIKLVLHVGVLVADLIAALKMGLLIGSTRQRL